MREIVVVGAGPAGLTAALYAARAGARVLVVERVGGQLAEAPHVENYPGIARITGAQLLSDIRAQVSALGVEFVSGTARLVSRVEGGWRVELARGEPIVARCVVAATGASRRRLGVPGERELLGAGVSYCAVCDGAFFKGRDVCVVGGGDSAVEDALYLSGICNKVYIVHRREEFRASRARLDRARAAAGVEFVTNAVVQRIEGDGMVERVVLGRAEAVADGRVAGTQTAGGGLSSSTLEVSAVFVAVGMVPTTAWLGGACALDDGGYAVAAEDCVAADGLWAAGDLRRKAVRQIVTACADGAVAGKAAADYLSK